MFNPSPGEDHFGFITFHYKATMVFNFADSQYHDKDALLEKIGEQPLQLNFHTRTDLALKMARDELFTEAGGNRPDKANIMFVFTDGKPTSPAKKKIDFEALADQFAADFKVSSFSSLGC